MLITHKRLLYFISIQVIVILFNIIIEIKNIPRETVIKKLKYFYYSSLKRSGRDSNSRPHA